MISKSVLKQYIDLQAEADEIRDKISRLEKQIDSIAKRIKEIEENKETVKDKVRGGMGGMQKSTL